MRTVIIGGGKGARAIINLAVMKYLKELPLEIMCVADPDLNAPGMVFARGHSIPTLQSMEEALSLPGIEMIIELTGQDEVLEKIHKIIPKGVTLMDHTSARIFWEVTNAKEETVRQLREITALEERIEAERLFLQGLVDSLPDLVVVLGPDRRAIKVNASFSKFTGISPVEAIGKTCIELLAKTELAEKCRETSDLLDSVFTDGKPHTLVWRTSSPEETYWEVSRVPIFDKNGKLEAVLSTWHRITERIMLQREIDMAEQRFRSFIDSAQDWISIKDLEGKYVIVNPVCARALNREPDEFTGKTPADLLPPEKAEDIQKHDKEVIRTNKHQVYEEVFTINGRDHYFQTVRFPLHDYKGDTIGVCTISRDVSAEKELREQLAQSAKLAAVGKLAAGVAHEINNPLTGILAYAEEMLEEIGPDNPLYQDMEVIIRETLRCRTIVRNLLDFSRQEKLKLEIVSPNHIVNQTLSLIKKLPQFQNITIETRLSALIPPITCDQHQLQQVVLNLMLNACDAMNGKGTIKVTTEYDRKRNKCLIMVEDNGPGIPENLIDKLFEPFFSTKGTSGLGLAVSWGIVERHHGTIEVDMAESGGAVFRIVLPTAEENR